MAIPVDKESLLLAINEHYAKLKIELDIIPVSLTNEVELEGHAKGTTMSICNLVAYLIGWGELVLKWNDLKEKEMEVDFPDTGYKWNELGKLAQKFYVDYAHMDYQTLLQKLDHVVAEIVQLIERTDRDFLYNQPWYKQWPMGKMIQLNTSSPYKNARIRVRKWKKVKSVNSQL